jgi:hypothetical protein
MLLRIFSSDEPIYYCAMVEGKFVLAEDCPDDVFQQHRKADEEDFSVYGEHLLANFDPELAEKYHLRTE